MLNLHRIEYILSQLAQHHRVSISDLSKGLQVSSETIRRDLKSLEHSGKLLRVHGAAVATAAVNDKPIEQRSLENANKKDAIARVASKMIVDQTTVFLDTGTTTLCLARKLSGFSNIKLYTNSVKVALAAKEHHGVTIFLTPGRLRPVEQDLVGSDTISYIQKFCFNIVFMGCAAIDLEYGCMDFEEDEAHIRRALIKHSRLSVILADSSKFGKAANIQTASFSQLDRIVTDSSPNEDFLNQIEKSNAKLLLTKGHGKP
ncbi:hypothetical protein MNBD_ALPHA11-169 [hydrothermal vent metagenome]|uniref:HTH deoR-type domain-containing protein n=1 Tax=hydrothermal vent metagenome TaxID=652676 RepID=A0A3B0T3K2_9ZZZZ